MPAHLLLDTKLTLCFSGKSLVGNRRFRHIISESIDDYNNAGSRKAKSAVVKKVHDNIRATGGRFLKLDSSQRMWVELTQQRSLEKVSHAIRDATSTNENMKKKKQKVHKTIAQVAAHVSSRFPSVHLEGKLDDDDDDDDELLAFKSVDSLHMSMPSLPTVQRASSSGAMDDGSSKSAAGRLESTSTTEETPMPPLLQPQGNDNAEEEQAMPPLEPSTKLLFPGIDSEQDHQQQQPRRRHSNPLVGGEEPVLASHQQQPEAQDDDFLSYINEVLGPVSPTDLDIDPLKKLARRKRKDNA